MLHHHELEKYTFFSQMADNRKVLTLPYQSGVSQFVFIYLQAIEQTFITLKTKQTKSPKTNKTTFTKRRSLMLDTIRLQECQHYDLYRCGSTQSRCSAQGESNVNKLKCLSERKVLIAWYFRMKCFPLIIKVAN